MAPSRSKLFTYGILLLIVVGALALRTAWTVPAAHVDGTFLLGESDAYYHKRGVDFAQTESTQLRYDPMLNYPVGDVNPNPPLSSWIHAVAGVLVGPFAGGTEEATWWLFTYSPAVFAALTIIPVFFLARRLAGTAGGLIAAFLLATSVQNMNRSHLGFADHDSMQLFFTVLGFYFLVRALDMAPRPAAPRAPAAALAGWKDWLAGSPSGAYAILAGAAWGGLALTWKGFPYAFGVVLVFAVVQMVIHHGRQRDVAPTMYATVTPLAMALLMALPYYAGFGLMSFFTPAVFLVALILAVGLFLALARSYPSVLALPGLALVGAVAAVIAFILAPTISRALLSRFVYFKQSTLYQTIAEANPADFNQLAFSIGPFAFFMFFIGLVWIGYRWWRERSPAQLLVLLWALVDIYAASAAARFLFTSTPSMAVVAGAATGAVLALARFDAVGEAYRALGGGFGALRRSVNVAHILIVVAVVSLLVAPNVWLAADAAVPASTENANIRDAQANAQADIATVADRHGLSDDQKAELRSVVNRTILDMRRGVLPAPDIGRALDDFGLANDLPDAFTRDAKRAVGDDFDTIRTYTKRFGAFGPNFISGDWRGALEWLGEQDTALPPADRPAAITWWDYGHWTITVGGHPAVADNFQHGYRFSGTFLTAQNETQALQLLSARLLRTPGFDADAAARLLSGAGVPADEARGIVTRWRAEDFVFVPELDLAGSRLLLQSIEEATQRSIRYLAVDDRMLPLDDPNTRGLESSSIFYAPVLLSGQPQKRYLQTPIIDFRTGAVVTEEELVRQQAELVENFNPDNYGPQLLLEPAFFRTMYYRGFIGTPAQAPLQAGQQFGSDPFDPAGYGRFYAEGRRMLLGTDGPVTGSAISNPILPGFGLSQFRLVYANSGVRMLEYTPGAIVRGAVTLDGEPLAGVRVTVFDDAWDLARDAMSQDYVRAANLTDDDLRIPHGSALTDAEGRYEVRAVFDTGGQVALRVSQDAGGRGPTPVFAEEFLTITRDDAAAQRVYDVAFALEPANWEGGVYEDTNENGTAEPGEPPVAGAIVRIAGRNVTTGDDGRFALTGIPAGRQAFTITADGYRVAPGEGEVTLRPGETLRQDVRLVVAPISVQGSTTGADEPIAGARITFNGTVAGGATRDAFTGADGRFTIELRPGVYDVSGRHTIPNGTYEVERISVVGGRGTADGLTLTIERGSQALEIEVAYRRS